MIYKTLLQAYANPSQTKKEIFRNCCIYARKHSAVKMGIIRHNCFKFTFAFETPDGNIHTITPKAYSRLGVLVSSTESL